MLLYYSILLFKGLKNEEITLSRIFLKEEKILSLFMILMAGSFIFFLGGISLALINEATTFTRITSIIYTLTLLYFVYSLQKVIREGDVK